MGIKFNSGMGGVTCSCCGILIAAGFPNDWIYCYRTNPEDHIVIRKIVKKQARDDIAIEHFKSRYGEDYKYEPLYYNYCSVDCLKEHRKQKQFKKFVGTHLEWELT